MPLPGEVTAAIRQPRPVQEWQWSRSWSRRLFGRFGGAVAARCAMAATGTDTGGSIRQPASFVGIVGIKPTYGRCSRWGIVAFASSLDQAGPMARTVADAAIMLGSMCRSRPQGFDQRRHAGARFRGGADRRHPRPARSASPRNTASTACRPRSRTLWQQGIDWLKAAGAEPVEISLPHTKYALATYYIIAPAEASSNLARYDGVRFGLRVDGREPQRDVRERPAPPASARRCKRRIMIGTYVLSAGYYDAYYLKAQHVRTLIARDFAAAFKQCRRHPDADRAQRRLRDRREHRRSDRDVSERRVHRAGQPRRPARHLGAGGSGVRRPAARSADHRPRLRRGDLFRRWPA